LLPDHQFGFRRYHSSIQQCHRVITIINETLDAKQFFPTVFLDIKQAFDKFWHRELLHKIKQNLPSEYYLIFKSYLSDRHFQIKHFTEVQQQIQKLNIKKAPGFELINGKVLSELPKEGIKFLVLLYNAVLRLKYWPLQLKLGQILLVQKPGKPPHEVTSYRPISLLPRISKILEKLLTARLNSNNILDELLPDHQFGFR